MSTPPVTPVTPAPSTPRRRGGLLRALGIVGIVIAGVTIISIGLDLFVSSDQTARDLTELLNNRVVRHGHTRVRIDRILQWRGNRARLKGVHLEYQVDGAWREAVRVGTATVTLQRVPVGSRWQVASSLDSVAVTIYQSADKRWRVPEFGNATRGASSTRVVLDGVVTHGSLRMVRVDGSLAANITSVALGARVDTRAPMGEGQTGTEIALRNAQFLSNGVGPYALDGRVLRAQTTRFDAVHLGGPGVDLTLGGELPPSSERGGAHGALTVDTRGQLARAIGYPVPSFRARGRLALLGTSAAPVLVYRGHGEYRDMRVDTLAVRFRKAGKRRVLLESASGRMGGDVFVLGGARGELDLERRTFALEVSGRGALDRLPASVMGRTRLPKGHAQGTASVRGRLSGPYDVKLRLHDSDVQGVPVTSVAVDGRLTRDLVDARGSIALPGLTVNGGGTVSLRAHTSNVPFTAEVTDLDALARLFGIVGLSGSGTATGRMTGDPASPLITAQGRLTHAALLEVRAPVARIDSFAMTLAPKPTVAARITADDATAGTMSLGAAQAFVRAADGRTTARFTTQREDGSLRLVGQSETVKGRTRLLLDEARARVGEDAWTVHGPVEMLVEGGRTTIHDAVATSDLGGRVVLRSAGIGPRDALTVRATLDSVLVGSPIADDATFWRGRVRGDVDVDGTRRAPRVVARIAAVVDTASRNMPIRSIAFALRASEGSAHVADIDVRDRAGGVIAGTADLRYTSAAAERLFRRDWDALDAVGLSGALHVDTLAMAPWSQRPTGGRAAIAGHLEGEARLGGTLARPDMNARLIARGVGSEEVTSDSIVATVRLRSREGQLLLDSVAVHALDTQAMARGVVPVRIQLPSTFGLAETGLHVNVDAPSWDLRLVPGFVPVIGAAEGTGSAHVTLQGDPHNPFVAGEAHVRNGSLRFAGRQEVFTDIDADADLADRGLTITRLHARQSPRGELTGTGSVTWGGQSFDYVLHLDAREVAVIQPGFFTARVTGKFDVIPGPGAPSPFVALIRGKGQVPEAVVTYEFRQEGDPRTVAAAPGQALQIPNPPILLDLTLHADRGVWLKNRESDIEMSGDLRVVLPATGVVGVRGEITLLRGRYNFLDTSFRIVDGRISFNDITTLNPRIDVTAEARVRSATGPNDVIQLTFSGTQTEPIIRATNLSDPGRPTNAILSDLAGSKVSSREAAASFGTNVVVRQFEQQFLRQSGLVDVFSVDPTVPGGDLTVGKYLFSELYVRYAQPTAAQRNVAVEYWMNRNVYFTGEFDLSGVASPTVPTESPTTGYRIGIKVRHEF